MTLARVQKELRSVSQRSFPLAASDAWSTFLDESKAADGLMTHVTSPVQRCRHLGSAVENRRLRLGIRCVWE
jgi:hypothetical protein